MGPLAQSFGFLHPAMAVAAGAAALIPIAIHLLHRRRHKRIAWAAMAFLLAATRQSRRRLFVEQWLLLGLRVALIALALLALARPFLSSGETGAAASVRVRRIFILDDSLSMQARHPSGTTRFNAAVERIRARLPSFREDDLISLITASGGQTVIREAVGPRAFGDRLSQVRPTNLRANWEAAFTSASELATDPSILKENTTFCVVSDFGRSDWGMEGGDGRAVIEARRLASEMDLALIPVAESPVANVAVRRLQMLSPLTGTGIATRIAVEVFNHGPHPARAVNVQVTERDRRLLTFEFETVEPGRSAAQEGTMMFRDPGTHGLRAEISRQADDVLDADDRAFLSVEVLRHAAVLLVDGDPGPDVMSGHAGYLHKALSPGPSSGSGLFDAKVVTELELPAESLRDYPVVVLCNVARLPESEWRRLENFVRAGGGLLIFAGDRIVIDHYNRHATRPEHPLLPGTLQEAIRPSGGATTWTTLRLTDPVHPLVAEFAALKDSGLFTARVERYLPLTAMSADAQVVLQYATRDPALTLRPAGNGMVALMTTTANMEWTNLPGKGDFVSLMAEVVSLLCGRPGQHRNIETGDTIAEPIAARDVDAFIRLTAPTGSPPPGKLMQAVDGALVYRAGPMADPGLYRLQVGTGQADFAVNVPAEESELIAADARSLRNRIGGRSRLLGGDDADSPAPTRLTRATELNATFLLVVMGLLFIESLLAAAAGGGRAGNGTSVARHL